jgi:hypothetical protein
MANKKISQLTVAAPLTGTEVLPIVQGGVTVQATAQNIADLAGGALPVETVYPTTDALKAGQRFWYKGNEWHYMTQAEIDSTGWTGLIGVGFPAPVSKVLNINILLTGVSISYGFGTVSSFAQNIFIPSNGINNTTFTFDFLGLGDPARATCVTPYASGPGAEFNLTIRNAQLLKSLEDLGTSSAVIYRYANLSNTAINNFFTALPPTTKTATIDIRYNPG